MFCSLVRSLITTVMFVSVAHGEPRTIVTTTDFTTGSLSSVDDAGTVTDDLLLIHSDARVRVFGNRVYIINRLGQDNIIVLDKDDLAMPLTQFSTGDGSNPHEMIVVSDEKAYVSVYGKDYLLVVNPATGDSSDIISLSSFSDADGLPEASQLAFYAGHLFVACQRLDRDAPLFAPTEFSTIAVVDVSSDALVDMDPTSPEMDGIRLTASQPFGAAQRGPWWVLAEVGTFGANDGGIEVVDLINREVSGILVSEEALGNDVNAIAMVSDSEGYVVLSSSIPPFPNFVRRFNLGTGEVSATLEGVTTGYISTLVSAPGRLYVADRSTFDAPDEAGVRVFDSATESLIQGPLATSLPPFDIAIVDVVRSDFDGNGNVDFTDFLTFATAFETSHGDETFSSSSDLDTNGTVDFADFLIFASEYDGP